MAGPSSNSTCKPGLIIPAISTSLPHALVRTKAILDPKILLKTLFWFCLVNHWLCLSRERQKKHEVFCCESKRLWEKWVKINRIISALLWCIPHCSYISSFFSIASSERQLLLISSCVQLRGLRRLPSKSNYEFGSTKKKSIISAKEHAEWRNAFSELAFIIYSCAFGINVFSPGKWRRSVRSFHWLNKEIRKLCRWTHIPFGHLLPDLWSPFMEESLILSSGRWKITDYYFSQMRPEDEEYEYVKVWNPTVANLTLMVRNLIASNVIVKHKHIKI